MSRIRQSCSTRSSMLTLTSQMSPDEALCHAWITTPVQPRHEKPATSPLPPVSSSQFLQDDPYLHVPNTAMILGSPGLKSTNSPSPPPSPSSEGLGLGLSSPALPSRSSMPIIRTNNLSYDYSDNESIGSLTAIPRQLRHHLSSRSSSRHLTNPLRLPGASTAPTLTPPTPYFEDLKHHKDFQSDPTFGSNNLSESESEKGRARERALPTVAEDHEGERTSQEEVDYTSDHEHTEVSLPPTPEKGGGISSFAGRVKSSLTSAHAFTRLEDSKHRLQSIRLRWFMGEDRNVAPHAVFGRSVSQPNISKRRK